MRGLRLVSLASILVGVGLVVGSIGGAAFAVANFVTVSTNSALGFDQAVATNIQNSVNSGRDTFRFDTFGSEQFFGGVLQLNQAIEGAKFGGLGQGVSPKTALAVGLKVDVDALPAALQKALQQGQVDLNDPATTLALLKLNAVVGLTGFSNPDGSLKSVGIQCALCHSTVDNSFASGIGHRLDGWPNRDLNVGAILNLAPDGSAGPPPTGLTAVSQLLSSGGTPVNVPTVRTVLQSWGPGKFDAELFMDGKAFNPQQVTDGTVTGVNVTGATLIPAAYGLQGFNLHTWTGWGSVTYWNAFVANLEMHGSPGTFFDPRLDSKTQFPIAAVNNFGHVQPAAGQVDRITPKLAALHYYQLSLPSPVAPAPSAATAASIAHGATLFGDPTGGTISSPLFDKARCATCHVPPLFTEPGYNLHKASEIGIDDFQSSRSPALGYRTSPLKGLWSRQKGGFYHDGRFATLQDVVNHYNVLMGLGLTPGQESDLVNYLLSL